MQGTLRAVLLIGVVAAIPLRPGEARADAPLPVCQLIATGGTIASKVDPVSKAPSAVLSGADLVAAVPELATVATVQVESPFIVGSAYMDPGRWATIHARVVAALARPEVAGVVVSHGTDTLEETAWFLDLTVPGDKPVVLVGSQRNASEADFDGPRNLLDAVRICVAPTARGKGVMIALNGQVNAAREATKTHTMDVGTFQSGDAGLLGVVDHGRVAFDRAPLRRQHLALGAAPLPRVDVVAAYAGADGALLRAAVAAGAKGVVIQGLGMGNVNVPLYDAIRDAIGRGVVVVVATRVPRGRVLPVYGNPGGGRTLEEAGAVFADNLSPHKARILLMLALQQPRSGAELQALFDR